MHPAATVFVDVGVQRELWPGGAWPLVGEAEAAGIARLFAIARAFAVRQGGIVCRHAASSPEPAMNAPTHCGAPASADERPIDCLPALPVQLWTTAVASDPPLALDRAHAIYVDSGCAQDPDAHPVHARAFAHLTAGVRDAVVCGAGVEYGLDRVVGALLRRRIRTHVALDALGAADEVVAQTVVAGWKRRGVDGTTVEMVHRMLQRG
jgi:hypothetical protein